MAEEPMQNMVAILPDGLDYNQRGLFRNLAEHFHAVLLAVYESVASFGITGMAAAHFAPFSTDGIRDRLFYALLSGPTPLICR
jgi:hypothetical protein